jgi:hypothetical protein
LPAEIGWHKAKTELKSLDAEAREGGGPPRPRRGDELPPNANDFILSLASPKRQSDRLAGFQSPTRGFLNPLSATGKRCFERLPATT